MLLMSLLDGHSSHYTLELVKLAATHHPVILYSAKLWRKGRFSILVRKTLANTYWQGKTLAKFTLCLGSLAPIHLTFLQMPSS